MLHVMQNAQFLGQYQYQGNLGGSQTVNPFDYRQALASLQEKIQMYSGAKPLVVCGGQVEEAKDMNEAQRLAEERAHQKSSNAYILKPVKMVAPKRDVVTTDLA